LSADGFIGIDVGTSGCRAIAIDANRQIIASTNTALPPSKRPAAGHSEQDSTDWWLALSESVCKLVQSSAATNFQALCIDGTSSTLLLVDSHGNALTPALMYDDRRATGAAARVAEVGPSDTPARGANSALCKLLYLEQTPAGQQAAHALHQADWLAGRLTGRFGIADENNALKLGYDPLTREWPAWLRKLDIAWDLLPMVVPAGTPIGPIRPAVADMLGLPRDLEVVAGTTDSVAATLAAGATAVGEAVTSLGSTLALKVWCETPIAAARYGVYSHRVGDRWLAGGASNSGGAVLRHYFDDAELAALSVGIDPDQPTGLDYYPLLGSGERFPFADPEKPACLEPMIDDRRVFLQGLLEGIAKIEQLGYQRLSALGAPYPTRVYTAGGGAINATWSRIRARLLGVPVERAVQRDAAFGAACLALTAFGAIAS
jgi:sugar (pentulose or hexulose) kinase